MEEQFNEEVIEEEEGSQESTRDWESEARVQGWKPEDEFDGSGWVDAQTFVERGEQYLGYLKPKVTRLENQINHLQKINDELVKRYKKDQDRSRAEIEQLEANLIQARSQAVTNADGAAFDQAEAQLKNLQRQKQALEEDQEMPQAQPQWALDWRDANSWYDSDSELRALADMYSRDLSVSRPDLLGPDHLNEVTKYIKRMVPQKFQRQTPTPKVEGTGGRKTNAGTGEAAGSQYAKLPPEAKSAFQMFVNDGIYENTKEARARYAAVYFEE